MLYTRKGDQGTTKVIDSKDRFSKNSSLAEALGSLDELNSFLGLCKFKARDVSTMSVKVGKRNLSAHDIVHDVQEALFIVQAQVAGADKKLSNGRIKKIEQIIDTIELEIPQLRGFSIAGGTELSSLFDIARTIARRTERLVVAVSENGERKLGAATLAYINRLSSLLFALARLSNHRSGITEESPSYR